MVRIAALVMAGVVGLWSAAEQARAEDAKPLSTEGAPFKGKTVAFVPVALGFDLTDGWNAMVSRRLEPLGVKFIVRDPNWSTDAGAQAITSLITEKVDLLIVHNPDIQSYARLLKRAQEAGIYVIQVNMQSSTHTDAYIGDNYVELGEADANLMVKKCAPDNGGSGKIAIIQGALTAAANIDRMKGIANVLSKHQEIKVVANQAADWDASKARAIADTVLKQNPDLCGIIGFWDGMDVGTGAAIREAKMQGKVTLVTAGGGESFACDNVSNGTFTAYHSADVRQQSDDIVRITKELLSGKEKPGANKRVLYTPLKSIAKATLQPDSCWRLSDYKSN